MILQPCLRRQLAKMTRREKAAILADDRRAAASSNSSGQVAALQERVATLSRALASVGLSA